MELEEVSEYFHVSGDYGYILKIYVKDMESYRDFIVTNSTFTIAEIKNETSINL